MAKPAKYVLVRGRNPDAGARTVGIAAQATTEPKMVRWLFILFVFTLPFEATDIGFMAGSVSISKIFGLLFFASYFFYHTPMLSKRAMPSISPALGWFLAYLGVYVFSGLFVQPELFGEFLGRVFTLTQVLVFFWIASDLLKDESLARNILLAYASASVLLAVGMILQIPGFYQEVTAGRATAIGENLNTLSALMAIALLVIIGFILIAPQKSFWRNIVLGCSALPVLGAMLGTGSRGGVAALLAGTFFYLLPFRRRKRFLVAVTVVVFGVSVLTYLVASSPEFFARWQESYYDGKLSDRENIFSAAVEMVAERPILGWGPVEASYQLGFAGRSWKAFDTHNLILHLLIEVGLVGTIPFLIGLCVCLTSAWKARSMGLGLIPIALLIATLMINLSGNYLVWKPQWLILALAIANASKVSRKLVVRSGGTLLMHVGSLADSDNRLTTYRQQS